MRGECGAERIVWNSKGKLRRETLSPGGRKDKISEKVGWGRRRSGGAEQSAVREH